MIDWSKSYQYLVSLYWAFQTITTVGFGDITPVLFAEFQFTLFWMTIGIQFYALLAANMLNFFSEADA
jgi:hyperpolarization activated cyclic nucleotide-gated potassium channel 1